MRGVPREGGHATAEHRLPRCGSGSRSLQPERSKRQKERPVMTCIVNDGLGAIRTTEQKPAGQLVRAVLRRHGE